MRHDLARRKRLLVHVWCTFRAPGGLPMASRKRRSSPRFRVGKASVYEHHGAWWVYYRDGGRPQRRKIGASRQEAEQVAAQVNAQLASGAPRLLTFDPIDVPELRRQFLEYHETVLRSSVGTVRRYRAATRHLEDFVAAQADPPRAHEVRPAAFRCRQHSLQFLQARADRGRLSFRRPWAVSWGLPGPGGAP